MIAAARFVREYLRPMPDAVRVEEVSYVRGEEVLPATLYLPRRRRSRIPGWVLLHGLTVPGRAHASLVRLARSLAASGRAVLVPEIPEWRELRVAPGIAVPTIRAAILHLDARDETLAGSTAVLGFSFGATQALVAAVAGELAGHLRCVGAWGGYCDLERVFEFGLSGEHDLDGVRYHMEPDPYGRWIIAGNYLTSAPGYADAAETAAALYSLALESGRRGTVAWDPSYDELKTQLRAGLPAPQRELFDVFAPPAARRARAADELRAIAHGLAEAALRVDPLLDPRPFLPRVGVPVVVAHGREDRLIPFTESFRLARALPPRFLVRQTVTSLFSHSTGTTQARRAWESARESARFFRMLNDMLDLA